MTSIQIDTREHCATLKQCLLEYGFNIEEKQLKFGDFVVAPDIVIERKTVKDFCVSILDGRLFNQAYRLAAFAENPIIIIEGADFRREMPYNMTINNIKGTLISLALTFRIPVLRTIDEKDSAWHIMQLSKHRARIGENRGSLCSSKPKKLKTQKERILRMFPGVGPKTAKILLEEFESIINIVNATPDELKKVNGLGAKTIEQIYNVVREEQAEYQNNDSELG